MPTIHRSLPSPFTTERSSQPAKTTVSNRPLPQTAPDYDKDLLDENLVQAALKKIHALDNAPEIEPPPALEKPHLLPIEKDTLCHFPATIPEAIHRFAEWSIPGETQERIARRASMHYNCAVTIANASLAATISLAALTILGSLHLFLGCMLACIANVIHRKTRAHLDAINRNLDVFLLSQLKHLIPQAQNSEKIAQNIAKKMEPTHVCSFLSWYSYMPATQAAYERISNILISKN